MTACLTTSSGGTTGARTEGKTEDPHPVSVTGRLTNCVVGPKRQGVGVTANIGTEFDEKISWLRPGVLLSGPILKRELRPETTVHYTKSIESRC